MSGWELSRCAIASAPVRATLVRNPLRFSARENGSEIERSSSTIRTDGP
jgi:hypothetical protein